MSDNGDVSKEPRQYNFADLLDDVKLSGDTPEPTPDLAICEDCGWKGKVADCESEWQSEGWEYPEYEVHICPDCAKNKEYGDITYDYSKMQGEKWQLWFENKEEVR